MAQTQGQRRASHAVVAWLAHHERNTTWLVRQTQADPGTIGDFLNGVRWPKFKTQGRIEKALGWADGTLTAIADGADAPGVGGGTQDADYVAAPGDLVDQAVTNEQVLAELRAMREDVNALSRRVARIESDPEPVGGADGST
jgi:hypothetical protein